MNTEDKGLEFPYGDAFKKIHVIRVGEEQRVLLQGRPYMSWEYKRSGSSAGGHYTLANIEKTGMVVNVTEAKQTTGGYLGIASFEAYDMKIDVQIEVSERSRKDYKKTRTLITNDFIPAYTLVQLSMDDIIAGKLEALVARHKPRDFYDYFFLLSGSYPLVRTKENLKNVLKLLHQENINFQTELKKFLPASHTMHLRDFKKLLEEKIQAYL